MGRMHACHSPKTGVEFSGLRRAEVIGQPGDYKKAYSNEGVEIIVRVYRDDIERFGYEFGNTEYIADLAAGILWGLTQTTQAHRESARQKIETFFNQELQGSRYGFI